MLQPSRKKKVAAFKHKQVVFVVLAFASSNINLHLNYLLKNDSKIIRKLVKIIYVNKCLPSVNDEEHLHQFIVDSQRLMAMGCFDLRGLGPTISTLDREYCTQYLRFVVEPQRRVSFYKLNAYRQFVSKRKVLSVARKIFDTFVKKSGSRMLNYVI